MSKTHSNAIVLLLAIATAILAFIAWEPGGEPPERGLSEGDAQHVSNDPREAVPLNAEQMQFALGQMRGFLETIETLDEAELRGDIGAMARAAGAHGPGKSQPPEGFRDRLPGTFRAMSRTTRTSFAAMEEHLSEGDLDQYRAERLKALGTCNTCHASFRFVVVPD
ncbi:hypothetical protein [Erythrobacter sp.]|uniref:hypothetical protein n=1 Tax=Erythrobacter sp. TaxID=1042 RepID=UPI001425C518|nr:hypothetical protein [Erythrobacter sp.]QIQ87022.1 MAG: cytochrome c [Erythrobacter sp.]